MGFLPASSMLWQVLASLMPLYEVSSLADLAATAPSPHAAGLPLTLCELAPLNQQFLALLTADRQPHWPAVHKRNIPGVIKVLLLWQEVALRLAVALIEGQKETAQAAAAGTGGGRRAVARVGGGAVGTDVEEQQQGQGLPAVSNEDVPTSRALTQLAASPALWAAAWAQLAAFCHGMYTWQGGKPAQAQPSSSSSSNNVKSSSSRSKSSRGSRVAGSSDLAGMFASLQLSPDHEQVAAVFESGEMSARIEALSIPAKGKPSSETALATILRHGFEAPLTFIDSVLGFHDRSVLYEGHFQQGASRSEGTGSRAGGNCSSGGGSGSGRGDTSGEGNSSGGGSSSGRGNTMGEGNNSGSNSSSGCGGNGSSNKSTEPVKLISTSCTGSSSGEACSSGRIWSSSRGGVAPAAALQLVLQAAALVGVVDRPWQSTAAVKLLCTMAKHCSLEAKKRLVSTRGGLVLDVLTAAARCDPGSFAHNAAGLICMILDGAGEGGWGLAWNLRSNLCAFSVLHG